ncbi:hypothetical protein [Salinactinospora qingdaonensis]|uniref:hypothetical protein n=1 Tax=Salinactinospora qingdaonensis TaxID=702744 RepID=UPI0031EA3106
MPVTHSAAPDHMPPVLGDLLPEVLDELRDRSGTPDEHPDQTDPADDTPHLVRSAPWGDQEPHSRPSGV